MKGEKVMREYIVLSGNDIHDLTNGREVCLSLLDENKCASYPKKYTKIIIPSPKKNGRKLLAI